MASRICPIERPAHLEGTVTNQSNEFDALNAIAETVSQSLDLDEILNGALDRTLEVLEVEAGGIYLLDEGAGLLKIAAQRGFKPELVNEIDGLRVGEGFSGRVVLSGDPLVVEDVGKDERLTRIAVREEGLRSVAIVPLNSRGKVLGTLFVITYGLRTFSERDLHLLASIGNQIGVATETARLIDSEQRRAEEFRVISEVGRRIVSILPVDKLLGEIASVLRETLGYYLVTNLYY